AVNRSNLEEASASRLIFREFVGRGLLETMLILPHIASMFLVLFRKDSRSLHDLLAGTVVIKFDLHNEQ
ncbi:MAG: RDD family protein, partial [Acholeplasmataceae bacterium]|nr:RDD family protein [Acholeplasmataceae bacterium]